MCHTYQLDPDLPERGAARLDRAFRGAGWEPTGGTDWDLFWDAGPPSASAFAALRPGQRINHYPGFPAFGHKGCFHRNLTQARAWTSQPGFFRFHPRTFSIPEEYDRWRALAEAEPGRLWIVKPPREGQGHGISVVRDPDSVPRTGEWVVQEYLDGPHLIRDRKYVLRFWLLITSLDPLVCYLHDDGVLKQASRRFTTDPDRLSDLRIHLTNPAVHRVNTDVAWGSLNSDLNGYREVLHAAGIDPEPIFAETRDALVQSVIACRDQALRESRGATPHLDGCFELLGPDILVDQDLRPWVLELNVFPSLDVSPESDPAAAAVVLAAKDRMAADMAELLKAEPGAHPTRVGGFRRVWPDVDAHRFAPALPLMRPTDRALASAACPEVGSGAPELKPLSTVEVLPLGDGIALRAELENDDTLESGEPEMQLIALNAVGAAAWLCLVDGLAPDEMIDELASVFPNERRARIEADLWDLLVTWAQMGLLEGIGPNGADRPRPTEVRDDGPELEPVEASS